MLYQWFGGKIVQPASKVGHDFRSPSALDQLGHRLARHPLTVRRLRVAGNLLERRMSRHRWVRRSPSASLNSGRPELAQTHMARGRAKFASASIARSNQRVALRPNYRIAPVTAVIVLLTLDAQLGPLGSAFYRILEIALGCFVGLVVSLVLLPARAHGLVISTAASMLTQLADLLGDWLAVLAGSAGRTRITQLQDNIRVGMARLEIVAGEARQERRTHLTQFDPDPLVLTIFRLRNDVVMIGRAAAEPLPGPIVGHLRQPLEQVSQAAQRFLRTSAGALRERKIPPALDAVEQALAKFIATIGELRREGATQGLSADDIGRLYALEFALEQQRQNFVDFRDRVTECAGAHSEA
jgi:hypothetical protein